MKKPSLNYVGDQSVRALLARYACPIPFHAVRTRFLGNIATPKLDASPVQTIKNLWGWRTARVRRHGGRQRTIRGPDEPLERIGKAPIGH